MKRVNKWDNPSGIVQYYHESYIPRSLLIMVVSVSARHRLLLHRENDDVFTSVNNSEVDTKVLYLPLKYNHFLYDSLSFGEMYITNE